MSENHHDDDKTQTHIPLLKDTKIGHYRIVEKIGAGGMGEVYLAKDTELDRKVALKFLPPHLCQDEDCRKRFKREAQAAAKLSHPNIIHVYEVSDYQGRPFFAMEHVEGRSLKEFSSDKDLSIEQFLELAIQICDGLHAAHEKGVTHRDIKPSNILIDAHSRVKIVDFGLASVVGKDQLTKTGSTLGTVGYMSPEQAQGRGVDHRSDLFSLGVVLYELITKQNPFKRDSEAATLKAVSDDLPEPLARFKSGLPEGLQTVIDKALEKDVKTRYQHADGLLSDFTRVKRLVESGQSMNTRQRIIGSSRRNMWVAITLIVVTAVILLMTTKPWQTTSTSHKQDIVMLAVLPFENLGDPENEFFADGMTDEIIGHLSRLSGIGVISRTSSMQFKDSDKGLQEIGKELGVDYIIEGTVFWDRLGQSNKVRIRPQLIKVDEDIHVWTNKFDANSEDIFNIQSTIAIEVAEALDVTLLATEQEVIQTHPTSNVDAYEYYLLGKHLYDRSMYRYEDHRQAIEMFEKAVALDSTFAAAYAWLARIHGNNYFDHVSDREDSKKKAKLAADLAVRHSDGGHEGHLAMGYYYYQVFRDYEKALHEFQSAYETEPNNGELIAAIGYVQRRLGKWDESLENIRRSVALDPLSVSKNRQLIMVLQPMRKFRECLEVVDRAIELSPSDVSLRSTKAAVVFDLYRSLDSVLKVIEDASETLQANQLVALRVSYYIWSGDYKAAVQLHDSVASEWGRTSNYWRSRVFYAIGDCERASSAADSLRLETEKLLQSYPNNYEYYSMLGIAMAILNRRDEAINAGKRAVEMMPVSLDAYRGAQGLYSLADIYIVLGEHEQAIDLLDSLLSIPSYVTVSWMQIDPKYAPLRDHPCFQALIEKYDTAN